MAAASPAAPWAGAAKDDATLDRRTAPADRRTPNPRIRGVILRAVRPPPPCLGVSTETGCCHRCCQRPALGSLGYEYPQSRLHGVRPDPADLGILIWPA
jgi:hypothetical protein